MVHRQVAGLKFALSMAEAEVEEDISERNEKMDSPSLFASPTLTYKHKNNGNHAGTQCGQENLTHYLQPSM